MSQNDHMSEPIQPIHTQGVVRKAYARRVESEFVFMLVATSSYLVDSNEMYFQGAAELTRKTTRQSPRKYYYHSITYASLQISSRHSRVPLPASITVCDDSGMHEVNVEPWVES